ncbi:LuxR C-terminal-related transcriptional regulator [Arthrobacter sp. Sr33]
MEAALAAALERADCTGALIYGHPGMGKSTLARQLMDDRSTFPSTPFLVQATRGLAGIPYGALAPYLRDARSDDMVDSLSVLRALVGFFRKECPGRVPLVVIDDAHELDQESSYLLAQLAIAGTVKVAALTINGGWHHRDLPALEEDGLLVRFDLQPLTIQEAGEICERLLGARMVRGAVSYFTAESGGNPLFLRSAISHAVRSQALIQREGHWVLIEEPFGVDESLRDLGESSILDLSDAEGDVLDCLALSGPERTDHVARLGASPAVHRLIELGLVREDPTNPQVIGCYPPLYSRIIRSLVPSHRSSELRTAFLDSVTEPWTAGAHNQVQQLNWALDCGVEVDDQALVEGARLASIHHDHQSALRLAAAVRGSVLAPAAMVEALRARFLLRLPLEGHLDLDALLNQPQDLETLASAAVLSAQIELARDGRTAVIHTLADHWSQRADELVQGQPSRHANLLRALALNLEGRFRQSEQLMREFLASGGNCPLNETVALCLLGESLGSTGRSEEGTALLQRALDRIAQNAGGSADLENFAVVRHVSLLIHNAEFDAAEAAIDEHFGGRIGDRFFSGGTIAVLDAVLCARRGRFTQAYEIILPAITVLRVSDHQAMLPYALAAASWVAAMVSEPGTAERFATEFEQTPPKGSAASGLLGAAYVAMARDQQSPSVELSKELFRLADCARSTGMEGCEKEILEFMVLTGDERLIKRLHELAASFEGGEARALQEYAAGVLANDPDRLIQAGDLAEEQQKHFVAVDASARALRLLKDKGDASVSRGVLRVLRRRRDALERPLSASAVAPTELRDLTGRELKIALMAANGASNREIAGGLTLSPRTVEGHLYRIYVKLGITRREDLALVVESSSYAGSAG